uniref:C2H2-type domain-containing protein n=1 Tax=Phlebotomus papatasi TaxID=29031 RepID=A0A1B0GM18_PHLPP
MKREDHFALIELQVEMKTIFGSCLDDMLRTVSCVEVERGDGLPDKMCIQCVLQVSRAFTFKQQCQKADATFRLYLTKQVPEECPESPRSAQEEVPEELPAQVPQVIECLQKDNLPEIPEDNSQSEEVIAEESVYFDDTLGTSEDIPFENLQIQDTGIELSKVEILPEVCCSPCDDVLATVKDLKVYETKIYHPCSICGSTFASPEELCVHSEEVHREVQVTGVQEPENHFECRECHKKFADSKILRRHSKTHLIVKPHVCLTCGKTFAESCNLTKHKKKHTGELRNVVGKPNLCSAAAALESLLADVAFVGFVGVVRSHMSIEMSRTVESSSAELADVWFLSSVDPLMDDCGFLSGEAFRTN